MKKFSDKGPGSRFVAAAAALFLFASSVHAQVADTVFVTDSSRYAGQYPEGTGVLYSDADGLVLGEFQNGVPDGVCTHYMPDGSRYYGSFRDGRHCGYGHFFSKSGKVLAGEFRDGYANGLDTLWYPDGSVYAGRCRNGRPVSKFSEDYGRHYKGMHVPEAIVRAKPVFREQELTAEQRDFLDNAYKKYARLTRNDKSPRFRGQDPNAFSRWITSQLKYPSDARRNRIEGVVMVKFVVDRNGSLDDVTVLESPDESLSKEALRVISLSPRWSPGVYKGEKVRVSYTFPVIFKL